MAMTKIDYFNTFREMALNSERADASDLVDFCDKQIDQLTRKSEKAAERAAKNAEPDTLIDEVLAVIPTEPCHLEDIMMKLPVGTSQPKVINRIGKLVKSGKVVKESVKDDEGHRKVTYCLA